MAAGIQCNLVNNYQFRPYIRLLDVYYVNYFHKL